MVKVQWAQQFYLSGVGSLGHHQSASEYPDSNHDDTMPETKSTQLSKNTEVRATSREGDDRALPVLTVKRGRSAGGHVEVILEYEEGRMLAKRMDDVMEVMDCVKEQPEGEVMQVELTDTRVVQVSKYKGEVYCGIFKVIDGRISRKGGMNFGLSEWANLYEYMITSPVWSDVQTRPPRKRARITEPRASGLVMNVIRYRWKWISDIGSEVVAEGSNWCYSDTVCLSDADRNKPDIPVFLIVETKSLPVKCNEQLMDALHISLLKQKLSEIQHERCPGCEIDAPGQVAHMEGCLMEWSDCVEKHLDEVVQVVTSVDRLNLYKRLKAHLGKTEPTTSHELNIVTNYKPPHDLGERLLNIPQIQEDNVYYGVLKECVM
jgi:hypothetical protein